jgi:hypothetical protein
MTHELSISVSAFLSDESHEAQRNFALQQARM